MENFLIFFEEHKFKILIVLAVCAFLVGYIIGNIIVYKAWQESVTTTVEYLDKLQILGKGNYDIYEVKSQINKIKETHKQKKYKDVVIELQVLEKIYPNLIVDKDFQRYMKRIK